MNLYVILTSILVPLALVSFLVIHNNKTQHKAPMDTLSLKRLQEAIKIMERIHLQLPKRSSVILEMTEEMRSHIDDGTIADRQVSVEYIDRFRAYMYENYNHKIYFNDLKPGLERLRILYFELNKS